MQGKSGPMQLSLCTYTIEDLEPQDYIVRKLETLLDLSFMREATRELYSKIGRPSIDPVPDHSTISQNRHRRPAFRKIFRWLFKEVVRQCVEAGLVSWRIVGTDSTHVKACASRPLSTAPI